MVINKDEVKYKKDNGGNEVRNQKEEGKEESFKDDAENNEPIKDNINKKVERGDELRKE